LYGRGLTVRRAGKVRAIGVSNFGVPLLRQLAADPRVTTVPATNQIELHPYLPLASMRAYAKQNGIVITAYAPFGQPGAGTTSALIADATLLEIAAAKGTTAAQVALSWGVQHGVAMIPRSENDARLRANISVRPPALGL
jgi:glycerol 2-dehydrogenase (NADP+)